jgi:CheY-like chemotaxis protein
MLLLRCSFACLSPKDSQQGHREHTKQHIANIQVGFSCPQRYLIFLRPPSDDPPDQNSLIYDADVPGKEIAMNTRGTPVILVIEDFADSRNLLSALLRAKGYKIFEARNGLEGVQEATRVNPDLILMDLAMPHMDGVEATRELRRSSTLAQIPIFAISAYATPAVTQDAMEAGCAEVFPKPLNIESLLGKIRERLGA